MPYVSGFDRNQIMMCTWDSFISENSIARDIDTFINSLVLSKYGIKEPSDEGRPAYDPKSMLKLYIYGNLKGISSTRKLAESCRINLEVKWMIFGVEPDYHTIANFRKENLESLKEICHEFNNHFSKKATSDFISTETETATTRKKSDRTQLLNAHTDAYLNMLDSNDDNDDAEREKISQNFSTGEKPTLDTINETLKSLQKQLDSLMSEK